MSFITDIIIPCNQNGQYKYILICIFQRLHKNQSVCIVFLNLTKTNHSSYKYVTIFVGIAVTVICVPIQNDYSDTLTL